MSVLSILKLDLRNITSPHILWSGAWNMQIVDDIYFVILAEMDLLGTGSFFAFNILYLPSRLQPVSSTVRSWIDRLCCCRLPPSRGIPVGVNGYELFSWKRPTWYLLYSVNVFGVPTYGMKLLLVPNINSAGEVLRPYVPLRLISLRRCWGAGSSMFKS